jgi:hypothetical protein
MVLILAKDLAGSCRQSQVPEGRCQEAMLVQTASPAWSNRPETNRDYNNTNLINLHNITRFICTITVLVPQ